MSKSMHRIRQSARGAKSADKQRITRPRGSQRVPALRKILRPIPANSHRRAPVDIHRYLRNLILSNVLPPETVLSQVEVASHLGVSRTPVREALRMLQEERLISAEPNYRCRILGFDPQELEALYVERITNEAAAVFVTVQNMKNEDVERLFNVFNELRRDDEARNFELWIRNHRAFHQILFSGANPVLQQRMYMDLERSERYVYNSRQSGLSDLFRRAAGEHEEIFKACKERRSAAVAAMLTDHLARAGIDIIAKLAPSWDPVTLRSAARLMLYGATHLDDTLPTNIFRRPLISRGTLGKKTV